MFSAWLFLAFSRHVALRICVLPIYPPILDDSKWLPPARIEGGHFPIWWIHCLKSISKTCYVLFCRGPWNRLPPAIKNRDEIAKSRIASRWCMQISCSSRPSLLVIFGERRLQQQRHWELASMFSWQTWQTCQTKKCCRWAAQKMDAATFLGFSTSTTNSL